MTATLAALAVLAVLVASAVGATSMSTDLGSAGATGVSGPVPSVALPSAPVAAGRVIASLDADVPIAAGGGWLVWSVPVAGGYGLDGSHGGVTRPLNVAPRPQPFDLNVGTSATGKAVVTFSRCAKTPVSPPIGLGIVDPLSGSGCRIRVLNLKTLQETTPAIPHPTGSSDTTPAMWRGRIAFARLDPAHHQQVQEVLLWTPVRRTLTTLRHGGLPTKCPYKGGCAGMTRSGAVQGLAYDGRLVSFLWLPIAPGVFGDAGWEVRADNVATGHSTLVTSGFAGEVCTGAEDLAAPSAPVLNGYTVSLVALEADCYVFDSVFAQMNTTVGGNGTFADLPGVVIGLAGDGSTFYVVEAPRPTDETNPTCTVTAPCQIQQISTPAPLQREPRKPRSPFY
jgi:hypothetical protein